jgi:hypothetical protein
VGRARALAAALAVAEEKAIEFAFDFEADLATETGACMFTQSAFP